MSPLDDELPAALHGRARVLPASPDPLAGIERRAARLRRRRVAASVAGSALAVAAVALVVPAVSGAPDRTVPAPVASAPPRTVPSPEAVPGLSPEAVPSPDGRPGNAVAWGTPLEARDAAWLEQWRATRGRTGPVSGEVLFRGTTNDSVTVHVYQLWTAGEEAHAVVAHSSEAGPEVVRDTELPRSAVAVDAVVPGTEYPALVIAHDPALVDVEYAADGAAFTPIEDEDARGVITERTGPSGAAPDRVRLRDATGTVGYVGDVWTGTPVMGASPAGLDPERPWPVRGDASLVDGSDRAALARSWAGRHDVPADDVTVTPLFVQRYEPSSTVEAVVLVEGPAGEWSWGVAAERDGGWIWYAEGGPADGLPVIVAALPGDEGVARLLLVASPASGSATYGPRKDAYRELAQLADGVFTGPLDGDPATDQYQVRDRAGGTYAGGEV